MPQQRQPIRKHIGQHNQQIQIKLDSRLPVMATVTADVVDLDIIVECGKCVLSSY
ncbi:MAG TPA: hypothetical protein VN456_13200 [Desulfosporosinus sp.]|nr:hypothetical protein [Desulfosporosinus sp.]